VLAVAPAERTVGVNQSFEVAIQVRTDQLVDGAAAFVDFDPAVLQVASIAPGGALPTILRNQVDNVQGRIDLVAGVLAGPFPTADFVLATVVFTARGQPATTHLLFSSASSRLSDITANGASIFDHAENGAVVVLDTILAGRVTPPGRPPAPHASWRIPMTVTLPSLTGGAPVDVATTLDSSGAFTLTGMTPGAYHAGVRGHQTLRNNRTFTLTSGLNVVDFGLLRGGDGDGDGYVTPVDFSILAASFLDCAGGARYDGRADFNGDACVTLLDFSILRANYGAVSDAAPSAFVPRQSGVANARLSVDCSAGPLRPGDRFAVEIVVDTRCMPVNGAAAVMTFDPAVVRVEGVGAGGVMSQEIHNTYDNAAGRIAYAAGELGSGRSGRFVLTRVELIAVAPGASTLDFAFAAPAQSDVTADGRSVLAAVDGWSVVVIDGSAGKPSSLYLPMVTAR